MKKFIAITLAVCGVVLAGQLVDSPAGTSGAAAPVAFAQSGSDDELLAQAIEALAAEVTEVSREMSTMQGEFGRYDDSVNQIKEAVEIWDGTLKNLEESRFFSHVEASEEEIAFCGVNVRICNGLKVTQSKNGLGNLIVGYNEVDPHYGNDRSGSHNVIVGRWHSYPENSSIAVGIRNTVGASTAAFGGSNVANRYGATVTGGSNNTAAGDYSSVSGGGSRGVEGDYDWVAGELFSDN